MATMLEYTLIAGALNFAPIIAIDSSKTGKRKTIKEYGDLLMERCSFDSDSDASDDLTENEKEVIKGMLTASIAAAAFADSEGIFDKAYEYRGDPDDKDAIAAITNEVEKNVEMLFDEQNRDKLLAFMTTSPYGKEIFEAFMGPMSDEEYEKLIEDSKTETHEEKSDSEITEKSEQERKQLKLDCVVPANEYVFWDNVIFHRIEYSVTRYNKKDLIDKTEASEHLYQ